MTEEIVGRTLFHLQANDLIRDHDPSFEFSKSDAYEDNPGLKGVLQELPEWWGDEPVSKIDVRTTREKCECRFYYLEGGLVYFELVGGDSESVGDVFWGFIIPEYVDLIFNSWDDQLEWEY